MNNESRTQHLASLEENNHTLGITCIAQHKQTRIKYPCKNKTNEHLSLSIPCAVRGNAVLTVSVVEDLLNVAGDVSAEPQATTQATGPLHLAAWLLLVLCVAFPRVCLPLVTL